MKTAPIHRLASIGENGGCGPRPPALASDAPSLMAATKLDRAPDVPRQASLRNEIGEDVATFPPSSALAKAWNSMFGTRTRPST